MHQIITSSTRGVSREELCRRWERSSMNDEKENGFSERTFHRIRRTLESVFDIDIECVKASEPRYRISTDDLGPGESSILSMILSKTDMRNSNKSSSLRDIMELLTVVSKVPKEDLDIVKSISHKLRRIPYEYGKLLIKAVERGEVAGANKAACDEDYRRYVCVWNHDDYHRNDLWLSIGIDEDSMLFYIVTSQQDVEIRERMARELSLDNGIKYRRDYWWYEPADKSKFQINFETFPDMEILKAHTEKLVALIALFNP